MPLVYGLAGGVGSPGAVAGRRLAADRSCCARKKAQRFQKCHLFVPRSPPALRLPRTCENGTQRRVRIFIKGASLICSHGPVSSFRRSALWFSDGARTKKKKKKKKPETRVSILLFWVSGDICHHGGPCSVQQSVLQFDWSVQTNGVRRDFFSVISPLSCLAGLVTKNCAGGPSVNRTMTILVVEAREMGNQRPRRYTRGNGRRRKGSFDEGLGGIGAFGYS